MIHPSEVSSRKIDVTHVSYSADFFKAGIAPNFGHFVFYSADFFKVRFAPFFGHFVFIHSADFFKARFAPFFGHFVFIVLTFLKPDLHPFLDISF